MTAQVTLIVEVPDDWTPQDAANVVTAALKKATQIRGADQVRVLEVRWEKQP